MSNPRSGILLTDVFDLRADEQQTHCFLKEDFEVGELEQDLGLSLDFAGTLEELCRLRHRDEISGPCELPVSTGSQTIFPFSDSFCLVLNRHVVPSSRVFSFSCDGFWFFRLRLKGVLQESWGGTERNPSNVDCTFLCYSNGMTSRFLVSQEQPMTSLSIVFKPGEFAADVSQELKQQLQAMSEPGQVFEPEARMLSIKPSEALLAAGSALLSLPQEHGLAMLLAEGGAKTVLAEALNCLRGLESPAAEEGITLRDSEVNRLTRLRDTLATDLTSHDTLEDFCKLSGMNRNKLTLGFKALFGETIAEYRTGVRLNQARALLLDDYSVTQVADSVGYRDRSSFSRAFKARYGVTPAEFNASHN